MSGRIEFDSLMEINYGGCGGWGSKISMGLFMKGQLGGAYGVGPRDHRCTDAAAGYQGTVRTFCIPGALGGEAGEEALGGGPGYFLG